MSGAALSRKRYEYNKLGELGCWGGDRVKPGARVNIYAVVLKVEGPKLTRGRDHVIILNLADETLDIDTQSFRLNVFGNLESLPKLLVPHDGVGSIVRVHRMWMSEWQQNPQGTCNVNAGANVTVFPAAIGAPLALPPELVEIATWDAERDPERLLRLRRYAATREVRAAVRRSGFAPTVGHQSRMHRVTTTIRCPSLSLRSLADVRRHSEPTFKFRVRVRLQLLEPTDLTRAAVLTCGACSKMYDAGLPTDWRLGERPLCGLCGAPVRWTYMMRARLTDATGMLTVVLYGDDASDFFAGVPAVDFGSDVAARSSLQERLDALQRSPDPLEICIKSYYLRKSRPAARRYAVCDTFLLLRPSQLPKNSAAN